MVIGAVFWLKKVIAKKLEPPPTSAPISKKVDMILIGFCINYRDTIMVMEFDVFYSLLLEEIHSF